MTRSRLSITLGAVALTALAFALPAMGTGTGTGPAGAGGEPPSISASVEQCLTAATQADRSVTFVGQMETVPGARRMAMQIVVEEHLPGEVGFHTLTPGGPGTWERSEAGLKIYKYVRQVTDLPAPAGFRAIVLYRWLNERGRVIMRAARHTMVCHEPAPRTKAEPAPAAKLPST